MAAPDSASNAEVTRELANASIGVCAQSFSLLDQAVETHLSRVDDISAQLDAAREEVSNTVESGYPALLQNTRELISLFVAIEKSEEAVERVAMAAKAAQDRLEALQKGYDSKYPEGISLFKSWLGARSRSAIDAPVTLPPWNPAAAAINAEQEIAALTSVLNMASLSRAAAARRGEEAEGVSSAGAAPPPPPPAAVTGEEGDSEAPTAADAAAATSSEPEEAPVADAAAAAALGAT